MNEPVTDDEKLWKEWAAARVSPDNPVVTGSITFGIKAYKSQLKKLIEERMNWFEHTCDPAYTGRQFKIAELKYVFELIDQVQPPQP